MITLKVEVSRKEGADNYGSIGAACAVEGIEVPSGSDMAGILRIRDHWLGLCEATVDDELARLRGTRAGSPPAANGHHYPEPSREAPRPERPAPARASARGRDEGVDDDQGEEKPPTDGRQLLGWAAKQEPDAKGDVIAFGKARKIPGKVVDWSPDQVRKAYLHVRGTHAR